MKLLKLQTKAFAIAVIFLMSIPDSLLAQKVAIIDAGSSGSRLYVYELKSDSIATLYPRQEQENESKGRALSSVDNNTDSINVFLRTMANKYKHGDTIPLYILATAGMRMIKEDNAKEIYQKINNIQNKDTLIKKGYNLKEAKTISGRYEGLYAWIAANYKNGKLKNEHPVSGTYGILEIGGASMQITFTPMKEPSDGKDTISHNRYNTIYSKSYLSGGVDQIYNTYKDSSNYNFKVPLNDVSELYTDTLKFLGQGTPIGIMLKETDATHFRDYSDTLPNNDSINKFHPWMNAKYISWVVDSLKLKEKLIKPEYKSNWTEGAALDILKNENPPESFNYQNPN